MYVLQLAVIFAHILKICHFCAKSNHNDLVVLSLKFQEVQISFGKSLSFVASTLLQNWLHDKWRRWWESSVPFPGWQAYGAQRRRPQLAGLWGSRAAAPAGRLVGLQGAKNPSWRACGAPRRKKLSCKVSRTEFKWFMIDITEYSNHMRNLQLHIYSLR